MPKAVETTPPREAPSTFEGLVSAFRARIERAALLLTGSPDEAEELSQETFVRAFLGWSRFAGRSEVFTWLYGILLNLCRTHWRRRRSSVDVQPEATGVLDPDPIEADEESEMLRRSIATLPEALRETLVLYYMQDLSLGEVGETLGIPLGTVKSRLAAARKSVREAMLSFGWRPE